MINSLRRHLSLTAVAATCAIAGVAAGAIADAGASSPATKSAKSKSKAAHGLRLRSLAPRAVEGSFVISTKQGFMTVTFARGTVQSVNGNQLTLDEGTRKASYKTVTLTLPADTKVRDNGSKSTLADVTVNQRAVVIEGTNRALVVAHDPRG